MTGADLIAQILKQEGVDFMGVIPFNSLEEAAAKAGIRPLIFRQERVGVNLADAYTRVTNGKGTGVFSMQAGPGAENAFAGVAQAYADSVPILLLPASAPRNRDGVHPTFSPSRTYESVVKWSGRVNLPEEIPNALRRAFSQLRLGRPSPVLLELPSDILRGELPNGIAGYTSVRQRRSAGDPQDVRDAAKLLLGAQNPVIHAGQGVLYAEAWGELQELAELTQTPVMTSMAGKSAFREDHPLSLGTRSTTTTGMVVHFLDRAGLSVRHRLQLHPHSLRRRSIRQQGSRAYHQRRERCQQGLLPRRGSNRRRQASDAAAHHRDKDHARRKKAAREPNGTELQTKSRQFATTGCSSGSRRCTRTVCPLTHSAHSTTCPRR